MLMPEEDAWGGGSESLGRRRCQRVEVASAVTSEDHRPSGNILDRKTEWVKFHRDIVVACKGTNRNEILNKRWRNKDIVQEEW